MSEQKGKQRPDKGSRKEKLSPNMMAYVGLRITVTLDDGTRVDGTLGAFDKHGNMVVMDAERTRVTKAGKPERQAVPVVMLRGQAVTMVEHTPSLATAAGVVTGYLGAAAVSSVKVAPLGAAPAASRAALSAPLQL